MGSVTGEGILGVAAGVTFREERGLFFGLGLDGAWRKPSGMSFQFSMAEGTAVVAEGTRVGADADFGGGGGRLGAVAALGGGFAAWSLCLGPLGLLSQLLKEDCSIVEGVDAIIANSM